MSQLIGSLGQLFVAVVSQLRIQFGRFQRHISPTLEISTDHFLFDRLAFFTALKTKSPCASKEILFDGYLMESDKTVQKDTFFQFFPTHEKARNHGRSQAVDSPPSRYAAVQWFGRKVVTFSRLGKTFFPPFLFDGKLSATGENGKKPYATREILFDGYLMEFHKLRNSDGPQCSPTGKKRILLSDYSD